MWLAKENWTALGWLSPVTDFTGDTGRWSLAFGGQMIIMSTAQHSGCLRKAQTMEHSAPYEQGARPQWFSVCWVSRQWYAWATEASSLKLHMNSFVQICLWVNEYSRDYIVDYFWLHGDCTKLLEFLEIITSMDTGSSVDTWVFSVSDEILYQRLLKKIINWVATGLEESCFYR